MTCITKGYHFGAADLSARCPRKVCLGSKDNNLMKYEQEAIDLRKASETGFREEFVGKLRASIEAAQIQIAEQPSLNWKALWYRQL